MVSVVFVKQTQKSLSGLLSEELEATFPRSIKNPPNLLKTREATFWWWFPRNFPVGKNRHSGLPRICECWGRDHQKRQNWLQYRRKIHHHIWKKKNWFRPQTKSSKVLLTVLSCLIMSNFWFIGHHHLTLFTMKGKMLMMTFEGKNLSIFSHYLPNGGYNYKYLVLPLQ